ncbi:hypothetical protein CIT292_06541 [Citrobacter youngae ATCC 29220]|uniref:Uncharacterized protein n=1 Tax=Citrobacter youngae ATCC 29220 TaxID=500640 RepID=D4B8J9_9ENTR|nr:hypothetical protein CIT292_06541 [Citrobacter youngae ATCC 29220]
MTLKIAFVMRRNEIVMVVGKHNSASRNILLFCKRACNSECPRIPACFNKGDSKNLLSQHDFEEHSARRLPTICRCGFL